MPSKLNKQSKSKSKSKSKLSISDGGVSSSSPSSAVPYANRPSSELTEDELRSFIEEASRKFPSLLGSSAVIGRVADVDSQSRGGSCRIWLSEASMVASSISPGSTVSVSLALSDGRKSPTSFPLSSLADECGLRFGVDYGEKPDEIAGNYFALATVFPSSKVLKDAVRLSLNLSHSLGCPAAGKFLFVFPIQVGSLKSLLCDDDKLFKSAVNSIGVNKCKNLFIEPLCFKSIPLLDAGVKYPVKGYSEAGICQMENDGASSPRTPLSRQLNVSSPRFKSSSSRELLSGLNYMDAISGSFDLEEIFGNESGKKLLEACATSFLCHRTLLCGNIITFPILSRLCIFRVMGCEGITSSTDEDITHSPNILYDDGTALAIDRKTKVSICLSTDSKVDDHRKNTLACGGMENVDCTRDTGDEVQKLGGLRKEYDLLKEIISSTVQNSLSGLGLRTTKGVLLHGPPGTGKTSLAQLCVRDAGVRDAGFNLFKVNGPEFISQYYGESEQELHKVFDAAIQVAPSVIFIDELDAIAPARKEGGEELSQRIVATLLNLMDGINRTEGLLIIGATNRVESIEPALRRPGRLDRELEIGVPSPKQRLDILTTLLSNMNHCLLHGQIQHLAAVTHGFVGADLTALCNEAAMACLRRYLKHKRCNNDEYLNSTSRMLDECYDASLDSPCRSKVSGELSSADPADSACSARENGMLLVDAISCTGSGKANQESTTNLQDASVNCNSCFNVVEEESQLEVVFEDFEKAKMRIRPSAMREVILEVPRVKWEDVGGQDEVKRQLMEAVLWPQMHHDAFKRIGTRPPTGVLMFGPPGCSKTLMARAVASEAGLNFLAVKGPELFSKWVGESEKAVRSLFAKARANAPSVIFFDEIDSLAVIRGRESDGISVADRVMSQLLVELDGLHQRVNVTVIAATNRPDKIDSALLRPGRFDRLLYVGPPNEEDRKDIFNIHLRKMPCGIDLDKSELARLTEGFTGADISLVCREAAMTALEESLDALEIKMQHLRTAIERARPSEIQPYEELAEKFQRLVSSEGKSDAVALASQTPRLDHIPRWNPLQWIMRLINGSSAGALS